MGYLVTLSLIGTFAIVLVRQTIYNEEKTFYVSTREIELTDARQTLV